jgi:hypothetical protein
MNQDKQHFEQATDELKKISAFLGKPRCITCEEFGPHGCSQFGAIPDEYLYKPNECKKYMLKIPF